MNTYSPPSMTTRSRRTLHWPLIVGLGVFALVRPVVSIVESIVGVSDPPAVPIGITVAITAVWVAVVGLRRVTRPVLTLMLAGVTYGVLAIMLSGIVSPIVTGRLEGPLANPIAIVPVLVVNAIWGLIAGALALALQHLRDVRTTRTGDPNT